MIGRTASQAVFRRATVAGKLRAVHGVRQTLRNLYINPANDRLHADLKSHFQTLPHIIHSYQSYKDISSLTSLSPTNSKLSNDSASKQKLNFNWIPSHEDVGLPHYLQFCNSIPPVVGSFVEFMDYSTNKAQFGVVLRESNAIFNEKHNKLTILRGLDGATINVSPQDITLHLYAVLSPEEVLTTSKQALKMASALREFIRQAIELLDSLANRNELEILFLQNSSSKRSTPVSLIDIVESLILDPIEKSFYEQSRYHRSILLMALHIHLLNTPNRWMVLTNVLSNRITNVAKSKGYSNNIVSPPVYISQPHINRNSFESLASLLDSGILDLKSNLEKFRQEQSNQATRKSTDDVLIWLRAFADAKLIKLLHICKLYLIYPHPIIGELLQRVIGDDKLVISPNTVLALLEELNVYNAGQLSDMYLSANIIGQPQLGLISVRTLNDLDQPKNIFKQKRDLFEHLRKNLSQGTVLYVLPGRKLALSLTTKDQKKRIGIHFPDMGTILGPKSKLTQTVEASGIYSSWLHFISSSSIGIFDEWMGTESWFKSKTLKVRTASQLASLTVSKREPDSTSCMSIWFDYDPSSSNPFQDLGSNIDISLNNISNAQVKIPSQQELEEILLGTKRSMGFSFFKRGNETSFPVGGLNDTDLYSIRYIQSVLQTYNKLRRMNGALLIDPSTCPDIEDSSRLALTWSEVRELEVENLNVSLLNKTIKSFAGDMTLVYCIERNIQTLKQVQLELSMEGSHDSSSSELLSSFADLDRVKDEVLIKQKQLFLPEFLANSYSQAIMANDDKGFIPANAKISAHNFLGKPSTQVLISEPFELLVTEGLQYGKVDIVEAIDSLESLWNQQQIVSYLHLIRPDSDQQGQETWLNIKRFLYLSKYGFDVGQSRNTELILNQKVISLEKSKDYQDMIGALDKKMWILRKLSNEDEADTSKKFYSVVVTDMGYLALTNLRIARGYCAELGIELQIALSLETHDTVGSLRDRCEIVYLDVVAGRCVMAETTR